MRFPVVHFSSLNPQVFQVVHYRDKMVAAATLEEPDRTVEGNNVNMDGNMGTDIGTVDSKVAPSKQEVEAEVEVVGV